ncbi:MAG: YibE/F family protein, partial [Anaerolineales bacterium]|nr:YibE/F family protein [Anaerolineales bacterium]
MNLSLEQRLLLIALLVIAGLVFAIWGAPYFFGVTLPTPSGAGFGSETVRAQVETVLEEGTVTLGEVTQPYQRLRVRILEGEYEGVLVELDYGRQQVRGELGVFRPGDELFIVLDLRPDHQLVAYFADYVRWRPLLTLLGLFIVSILFISRWKGLRSLLALAFSLLVITGYILPHILLGEDPVRVSLIGAGILLGVTLYLTYGWTLKTHAAVLSMLVVLVVTGGLAWLFVVLARLTGYGDESALFLLQLPGVHINLRGLLLGGMIIGALGVLDDLVTTQAAAVFELHAANPSLGLRQLFGAGLRIGQDHVAATVNTLVLAYAGTSLPMLLLFTVGSRNYLYLVNSAVVAEEIVRTLVGSLGLIAAVPISTLIAALLALYHPRLGALRP